MKKFWFLLVAILVLSLGLIAAGCPATDDNGSSTETEEHDDDHDDDDEHGDDDADDDGNGDDDAGTADGPSISIAAPEDGSEVAGPDVEVVTEVEGFEVSNKVGEEPIPGEGHIHWNVDGGGDTPSFDTSFTLNELTAGEHTIQVKLHNHKHILIEDVDSSEVTITVTE